MQELVNQAHGDSVTVDRLNGDEEYYPDASLLFTKPYHAEGEVPHYTVLLTTSSPREEGDPRVTEDTGINTPSDIGQLVVTNHGVHFIGGDRGFGDSSTRIFEIQYGRISAIESINAADQGRVSIFNDGVEQRFYLASSGDSGNVQEAMGYIREQI